jgi:1,2-dihydroxy-3-keto-5-methylthiopentene dioxygenase
MAVVRIPDENLTLREPAVVRQRLAAIGIDYHNWRPAYPVGDSATPAEVLGAYAAEIGQLKHLGGYVTADVIDVHPETAGLSEMLARFSQEHWHDEDEVRFILAGRGIFHVQPSQGPVVAIEVEPAI